MKTYHLSHSACQMNENDPKNQRNFKQNGLSANVACFSCDVVVINTCSVREKPKIAFSVISDVIRRSRKKIPIWCLPCADA